MFYLLIIAAVILFIAHVALLLLAFQKTGFSTSRYFYSHLTLWLTGVTIFCLAWLYSNTGNSTMLAYFNTPFKCTMILVFTLALSLVAHCIVTFVVLPLLNKNKQ